jgi:hypothetical protein
MLLLDERSETQCEERKRDLDAALFRMPWLTSEKHLKINTGSSLQSEWRMGLKLGSDR